MCQITVLINSFKSTRSCLYLFSDAIVSTSLLQDLTSEERFHVELHFSPGVKGVEEEENAPTGFGFRPASAEVARQVGPHPRESQPLLLKAAVFIPSSFPSPLLPFRTDRNRQTPAAWRTSPEMRQTGPCRCRSQSPFREDHRSYATTRPAPWR